MCLMMCKYSALFSFLVYFLTHYLDFISTARLKPAYVVGMLMLFFYLAVLGKFDWR